MYLIQNYVKVTVQSKSS